MDSTPPNLLAAPNPQPTSLGLRLSGQSFSRFSEFITRETGIRMPPGKLPMLQSRLQRRLRQLNLDSLEDYQRHLFQSPNTDQEWIEFINLITTNKTDFFREPKHFDYLTQRALPSFGQAKTGSWHCHLWCAGCSSGEEPYTLSMVLAEYAARHPGFEFSILGTDISTRVLNQARDAIYEEVKVDPVPDEYRHRYLMRSRDRRRALFRVVPELRQRVRFGRLNFMSENYGLHEKFDIVFFRNVMIYFEKDTQQQVLTRLCAQLRPGGYLFAGHSESLVGFDLPLQQMATSVYRRLR